MMSYALRFAVVFSCHHIVISIRSESQVAGLNVDSFALHYNTSETVTDDCGFTSVPAKWRNFPGVMEAVLSWDVEERGLFNPSLYWYCKNSKEVSMHSKIGCQFAPCWYTAGAGVQGFIAAQLSDAVKQAQGPVADIGSGTGWLLNVFRGLTDQQVWGVDGEDGAFKISESLLRHSGVKLLHGFFPSAVAGQHFSVVNIGFAVPGVTIESLQQNGALPASIRGVLASPATILMPVCLTNPSISDFRCKSKFVKFVVDSSGMSATVVGPEMTFVVAQE